MSSEGGRWPKKLYIFFDLVKNEPEEGDRALMGDGGASGIGTPSPDMTLTVDARFICLVVIALVGVAESSSDRLPSRGPAA